MAKPLRQHAPGCVFHITARTQGKHPWFTDPLKCRIEAEIIASGRMAGTLVLAQTVMPNHFHIVVRQGTQPLSFMMHRVMHRTAIMLKKTFGMDGHVFGAPYWSGLCESPAYVRRAIIYTHLNPTRSLLCAEPHEYSWSSHRHYVEPRTDCHKDIARDEGLQFFCGDDGNDPVELYLEHVRFQMAIDAYMRGEVIANVLIPPAPCTAGNVHWDQNFSAALQIAERLTPKLPVYDVACRLLARLDPQCSLDLLRTRLKAPKLVRLRRNLIAALISAGYRQSDISRLMGISKSAVSSVAVSLRT